MTYQSTKTYGHETGLSCTFRQWRAQSHCSKLHGYALSIKITFGTVKLNSFGWVVDFGGLKDLKVELQNLFDHKTLVSKDDPQIEWFREGERRGVIDPVYVENTGCEAFAKMVFDAATKWVKAHELVCVHVVSVEIREHGANSAVYTGG